MLFEAWGHYYRLLASFETQLSSKNFPVELPDYCNASVYVLYKKILAGEGVIHEKILLRTYAQKSALGYTRQKQKS